MGTYRLLIKDDLNNRVTRAAKEENVSVEDFIVEAIKEKHSQSSSKGKHK